MRDLKIMFRWLLLLVFIVATVVFAKAFMIAIWVSIALFVIFGVRNADKKAREADEIHKVNKKAMENLEQKLKDESEYDDAWKEVVEDIAKQDANYDKNYKAEMKIVRGTPFDEDLSKS